MLPSPGSLSFGRSALRGDKSTAGDPLPCSIAILAPKLDQRGANDAIVFSIGCHSNLGKCTEKVLRPVRDEIHQPVTKLTIVQCGRLGFHLFTDAEMFRFLLRSVLWISSMQNRFTC